MPAASPYDVLIIIPYNDMPEWLELATSLWLAQEGRVRMLITDNRGRLPTAKVLYDKLMAHPDVDIAELNLPIGFPHNSDPVAIATDHAFARCQGEYVMLTHSDVFPRHRGVVKFMVEQCNAENPAIGWEMSVRGEHAKADHERAQGKKYPTPKGPSVSDGCIGHVCSIFHLPTMDRINLQWNMRVGTVRYGYVRTTSAWGWPDTETVGSRILSDGNAPVKLLGRETNYENQITEHWMHLRTALYGILPRHVQGFADGLALHREWGLPPLVYGSCPPVGTQTQDVSKDPDAGIDCRKPASLMPGKLKHPSQPTLPRVISTTKRRVATGSGGNRRTVIKRIIKRTKK